MSTTDSNRRRPFAAVASTWGAVARSASRSVAAAGAVAAFGLGGCQAPQPVTVTEAEIGKTITVQKGGEIQVVLPSNHSTGFAWEITQDGAPVLLAYPGPEYNFNPSGVIGAGGTDTFRFGAEQVGQTQIGMVYVRPWEANVPPAKVATFNVTVTQPQ
ncbi:MAG: protease inhibitor I42 family protein [Phycisphaerales bacterium]